MPHTESTEASVANILKTLESKEATCKDRCNAYNQLTSLFRENEASSFGSDMSRNITRVLKVIKNDVNSNSHEVTNIALQILGACLYDTQIACHIKKTDCIGMLKTLCLTVHNTKEKSTCSCALWCLKSQNLDPAIITSKADDILMAVEFAVEKWSGLSVSVIHECISTIERLNSQAPNEMRSMALRWGKLLIPLVVHGAIQVREGALTQIEQNLDKLKEVHKDLIADLKPVIRQKVLPALKGYFKEGPKVNVYALKVWSTLVQLYGEELHHASYINEFLPVVELGFKSTEPRVKVAAFQAWRNLIDNFAISRTLIQDPKRVKLIMQVFKHNNARTETVAMEKLTCWWHFLWLLGSKVSPNFDMVAGPLLHFCIGGRQLDQNGAATPKHMKPGTSPVTPHLKLSNAGHQDFPVFQSLHLLGCEALAHFLGSTEAGETPHKFRLDPLTHEVVTGPSFFIKHSTLLITSAIKLFTGLGQNAPESLVVHIWQWLIAHLRNAVESPAKLDIRETLSILFLQFQKLVQSKTLPNDVILKMFTNLCAIPKKILCSSAYSIGGEEMIHGTPALFITGLFLDPALLADCSQQDAYHDLFSSLLTNGTGNSTSTLGFLQSMMEILKENAKYVEEKETLWRLWSALEHLVLQHISKTNEINQGDSLEHDFGCSVQTLIFPVIQDLHELPQTLVKSMIKSWSELYKTVNRLAAMVANAEANIVCEEVCSHVLDHYLEKDNVESTEVDMLVQMCRVVVTSLYFSSVGSQPMFKMAISPKKLAKNRHKPLENIHSVVALLGLLQKKAVTLVKDSENFKKSTGVSIQTVLNNLVETFSTIFVHVTSSNVISNLIGKLGRPIGDLFADAQRKTSAKVYNNSFDTKLEKLWLDMCTCLQSRYTGLFDSDFLEKCSPLLEATFLHPRRQIKNQTMSLWTCTFGKAAFLSYPESLKPVLSKVKAKSMIQLPNWVATISPVIDETPISQMTQTQAPEPRIPGMPSPHKIHGSFLNKPVSPKPSRSPIRAPPSPVSEKKKKLNLDRFSDGDFVLIKHTPKKKMVLTEHQKEVMKEKSTLPAMYNSLEHSVDASLMAAHFTTDTQMDGTMSETPTPTSQPFSLFGSVVPPSNPGGKEKEKPLSNKRPVTNKLETMKAAEKMRKTEAENNFDTDSDSGLRRSSRFRDHEEKEESSDDKWTKFRTKKSETFKAPLKKNSMTRKTLDNSLIIIDDDDEPTDGEFGTEDEPTDTEHFGNDEDSTDIDFGTDEVEGKEHEEPSFKGKFNADNQVNKDKTAKDIEKEPESEGKNSGTSDTGMVNSVPQNVLGALDFFQSLSSRSGLSKGILSRETSKTSKESSGQEEKAGADFEPDPSESKANVSKDTEKASSEPLQSWTKKLNELNSSPRPASPARKWSSQSSALSPEKKFRSSKSPKRIKKKPGDENEEKGALDKWIVRSPAKNFVGDLNTDIVVANVSQTLVEETQSPTKFADKGMKGNGLSSSVMETPPKNVLENITVSHSNSNRKLFSSQSSNPEYKFCEDSNIVPGSPNSKSYRCGTPVLKLKKLTDEEIMRYSPSRKNKDDDDMQFISGINVSEYSDKSKRMIDVGDEASGDQKQNHDDFSAFTPLEKGLKEIKNDSFFCSEPSSAEQAMLKLDNNVNTDKVSEFSGSENLFSQSEKVDDESEKDHIALNIGDELNSQQSPPLLSCDAEAMDVSESLNVMETKEVRKGEVTGVDNTSSVVSPNNTQAEVPVTSRRGRKRKQITPKKLTPEDIRNKRKKEEVENQIVVQKLSKRLKNKRDSDNETKNGDKSKLNKKGSRSPKTEVNTEGKDTKKKRGPKGRKKNNSGSPNSVSSAESSHEELEVSVLEDILDLEEDQNCVKTLTEIKKDLKKNKKKVEKVIKGKRDTLQKSETVKSVSLISEETNEKENVKENVGEGPKVSSPGNENNVHEEDKNVEKDMNCNDNGTVIENNPYQYEDISECEGDTPQYDSNKNFPEKNISVPSIDNQIMVNGSETGLVETNVENLDPPVLEMEGATFTAVKLGDDVIPPSMDCKTDGTQSSPTDDRAKDYVTTIIESSDEEKDLPDIEKRYYDESENPFDNVDLVNVAKSTDEKNISFSDDDVPLAEMTVKGNEKCDEKLNKKKPAATASKQKTQSSKTRLRLNESKSETTGGKQTRRVNFGKKIGIDDKTVNGKKVTEAEMDEEEVLQEEQVLQEQGEKPEKQAEELEQNDDKLSKLEQNEDTNDENYIDETPKKGADVLKSNVAAMMMMRNSDSKLVIGSRKLERKSGVVRRSILKQASEERLTDETQSPKRTPFHPISVSRIYSPTASPSASILKKRRLDAESLSDTNSPPMKQRRVSFATPLADVTRVDTDRPPSPLVKMAETSATQESVTLTQSGKFIGSQSTQGSPSQKNYVSSQDTQINNTDPVCPALMDCDQSVEKILPQLTSSIWSRGLGQLVRARNIRTIGDLSSLTEGDIHGLPIRSPKVDTVKKVLTKFAESKPEMKQVAEVPPTTSVETNDIGLPEDVDEILANSESLLEAVNSLTSDLDTSEVLQDSENTSGAKPDINLRDALLNYCEKDKINVQGLSANDLVKMSQNLTAMLSEVSKAIEAVVNTRCRSPWR
ncbi:telomere-associated protein RIF1-like isoform X2 [Ruditapes philippinarum]|uniref:telomere-associated protein RIF1-like isoform X2 n=1 Tax=Ruditapes philippinarum TaxID=129788 RepID=UPI00295B4479|nr:telomere-associated protein RIF1-like isoform X2 [Ruditapes philippinarum]